jgi:hypothetical protein
MCSNFHLHSFEQIEEITGEIYKVKLLLSPGFVKSMYYRDWCFTESKCFRLSSAI